MVEAELLNKDDFKVTGSKNIINLFIESNKQRNKVSVAFCNDDGKQIFQIYCNSFEDKGSIELEALVDNKTLSNNGELLLEQVKNSGFIMGEMFIDSIRVTFHATLKRVREDRGTTIFFLNEIFNVYRFQKRSSFRAKVPLGYGVYALMDSGKEKFKIEKFINLSDSGALIEVDLETELEVGKTYSNVSIHLPEANESMYKTSVTIKHSEEIKEELKDLTKNVATGVVSTTKTIGISKPIEPLKKKKKFKIGLHLSKMSPGLYNELNLTIANLARRAKNNLDD